MPRAKYSATAPAKQTRAAATKIPDDVFADLAVDVARSGPNAQSGRPLKRRRIINKDDGVTDGVAESVDHPGTQTAEAPARTLDDLAALEPQDDEAMLSRLDGNFSSTDLSGGEDEDEDKDAGRLRQEQVVYDDTSSDQGSDVDWENLLSYDAEHETDAPGSKPVNSDKIQLDLNAQPSPSAKRSRTQRLPATTLEKRKRLAIHKLHLCTLLAHVYIRNEWCNDHRVQHLLSLSLDARIKAFLDPKPSLSQRDQTTKLTKGLEDVSHAWRGKFVLNARGMRKPQWPANERELEIIAKMAEGTEFDRSDFLRAAAKPAGSRDVGAQLFCALLRSAGVDARLVCSLQALSFTSVAPVVAPNKEEKPTVDLTASGLNYDTDAPATSARSTSPTPRPIRRFGHAAQGATSRPDMGKAPEDKQSHRIRDSKHPVFWVEVFNKSKQQWIPVDAFATRSVNRPGRLEPAGADPWNDMSYVVAFNEDGTAKDVTRRYAKAYNAKTRRNRVESSEGGEQWVRSVLKLFRFPHGRNDRDTIENGELDGYEAKEPMPKNVQDFRGHPYYALDRHLRRHEVIHPRREVGKLRVGKADEAVEGVFRRRDVKNCQTADKWYRSGRELKAGEQPLKRVKARLNPRQDMDDDDRIDADGTVGLYAHEQTELYKPPPCEYGKIPKNPYKNLDVYVPSMIPPGGVHIRSSDAVTAARILRIDYAEAVTGFQFRGRKGTAVVKGVVVAAEDREAIEEVVEALRWQRVESDRRKQVQLALGIWKRFLVGLRVRERVMCRSDENIADKSEADADPGFEDSGSEYQDDGGLLDTEGGFLAADDGSAAVPTRGADRDVVKEKFQDDLAETVNDDLSRQGKEYWEPSVASPWDVPGLLKPVLQGGWVTETHEDGDLDALFEEPAGEPVIASEAQNAVLTKNDAMTRGSEERGFLPDSKAVDDGGGSAPVLNGTAERGFVKKDDLIEGGKSGCSSDGATVKARQNYIASTSVAVAQSKVHDAENSAPAGSEANAVADVDADDADDQSLLLEDPDDEDAEPDWLADEVGL